MRMAIKIGILALAFIALIACGVALFKLLMWSGESIQRRRSGKPGKRKGEESIPNAAKLMPLRDIDQDLCVMNDGTSVGILEVDLVNEDLFSKEELIKVIKRRAAALSNGKMPFMILSMPRPADTTSELHDYKTHVKDCEATISELMPKEKNRFERMKYQQTKDRMWLLENYLYEAEAQTTSTGNVKMHTYIVLGDRAQDAKRKIKDEMKDYVSRFASAGMTARIIRDEGIARIFMDNNVIFPSNNENTSLEPTLPVLNDYLELAYGQEGDDIDE